MARPRGPSSRNLRIDVICRPRSARAAVRSVTRSPSDEWTPTRCASRGAPRFVKRTKRILMGGVAWGPLWRSARNLNPIRSPQAAETHVETAWRHFPRHAPLSHPRGLSVSGYSRAQVLFARAQVPCPESRVPPLPLPAASSSLAQRSTAIVRLAPRGLKLSRATSHC